MNETKPSAAQIWMQAQQQMLEGWGSLWRREGPGSQRFAPLSGLPGAGFSPFTGWFPSYLSAFTSTGNAGNMWFLQKLQELLTESCQMADSDGWKAPLARFFQLIQASEQIMQDQQNALADLLPGIQKAQGNGGLAGEAFRQWLQPFGLDTAKWLELPSMGPFSQLQRRAQQASKLYLEALRTLREHNTFLQQGHWDALNSLHKKLLQMAEQDKSVQSLSELRKLWIHYLEQSYQERVMSAEYSRLYGEMVNASLRWRQYLQQVLDQERSNAGLPVRREMDAVLQQLKQRRQETRENREVLEECLHALAQLREEIESLAVLVGQPEPADPATHPAPAQKKKPGTKRRPASAKKGS